MFRRILVPLGGSSIAEQALPDTETLAHAAGIPVTVIQVIDLNRLDTYGLAALIGAPGQAERLAVAEREAGEYFSRVAKDVEGRQVTVTTAVWSGDPARVLVGRQRRATCLSCPPTAAADRNVGSSAALLRPWLASHPFQSC